MLLPLPAAPVEVAAETLALVGIEIKLVAELHEVYGQRAPGSTAERMLAYLAAWAHRRGVALVPGGFALAVGSPLRRRLQRRLLARAGRSAVSLGPLLTAARRPAPCSTAARPAASARRSVTTCAAVPPRGRAGRAEASVPGGGGALPVQGEPRERSPSR